MDYFIYIIFGIIFLAINLLILKSDISKKIIPNKYLLYLLFIAPIFYLYILFFQNFSLNFWLFFLYLFLSVFVSFLLYYFWVWSAWDAKYLLVLSLFIPHIPILSFVWNIALITIIYLLLYFIYFYVKCSFDHEYTKWLVYNIKTDIKDKFLVFIQHDEWNIFKIKTLKILLNWLIYFLFFFISFRLFRLFFVNDYIKNNASGKFLEFFNNNYLIKWLLFFWILLILRILIKKIFHFIMQKLKINPSKENIIFPILLFVFLIWFIIYEYSINPYEISSYLSLIFSFYILLYILFRILRYAYKLTFYISETYYLDLKKLKAWDIVDKDYLIKIFWEQKCLWYWPENPWILHPSPKSYFLNISNPIDEETSNLIKKIFKITNEYHEKNKTQNFSKIEKIKVLYTFSFSPYIFWAFILTVFFQDKIFKFINDYFINLISSSFH